MTAERVRDAGLAVTLLAIDPGNLGGLWLRARHGPVKQAFSAVLETIPGRHARISPETTDDTLFGGIDLSDSLATGRIVARPGLLDRADVLSLSRADTATPALAARLSGALDRGSLQALILADEAAETDDLPPPALRDRVAFFITDDGLTAADMAHLAVDPEAIRRAWAALPRVRTAPEALEAAVGAALGLGCMSTRASLFLLSAARAAAALDGADAIGQAHLELAARLVLSHRIAPPAEQPEEPDPETQAQTDQQDKDDTTKGDPDLTEALTDIVLDAAKTTLPDGLLTALAMKSRTARGSGQGAARTSSQRGRPLPSRNGHPDGRHRIDLLATLQAAAPWQKMRSAPQGQIAIRPQDFRIRRYRERAERLLIFLVDASGSAAMARLAEAKGAAELLLAEAYASRDHVALVSFRNEGAEVMLPPTRSLVRTKRALGGLAGGGPTPLAAGLKAGLDLALSERRRGLTPQVILLTDGRANMDLSGQTDRAQARDDAQMTARQLHAHGVPVLLVDSGMRHSRDIDTLARTLDAQTIRLPRGHGAGASAVFSALE